MKRISTSHLTPGMTLAVDACPTGGEPVLTKGTVLTDKLIMKLELYGILTVQIEDAKESDAPVEKQSENKNDTLSYSERIRLTPAFQEFKNEYSLKLSSFKDMINSVVEKNMIVDMDVFLRQSAEISSMVGGQVSLLTMLENIREYDNSTYAHSLNVALLCNLFATWMKLDAHEVEIATACGLLHDLGKLMVPHTILKKPSKLTDDEYEEMQKHPLEGYRLLKEKGANIHIQNSALMHHERIDGTGYPLHLKGDQIDRFARITAIADVYDAMTSVRVYRRALCPFQVIETFENEGFLKYDAECLLIILENIVNSYIQNRCRLSNGQDGDIIFINKEKLSRPIVKCGSEYVNLAECSDLTIEMIL